MPPVAAAGLSFDRKDSYELWGSHRSYVHAKDETENP
jgi:hypothetical protein